ncbi:DEAD-box ATP-dependent RNA helicase 39 [Rhododendron vialii]|uniref:DEAD-box ATP-dependent RNA helicase 39 n=1 Tax=Rhododendron vialii TaxID=182163 RepID=UPI00265FEEEB|nr:DEAD-box ATP-dependent RNA helicase 39 [Rhododendron vialii]
MGCGGRTLLSLSLCSSTSSTRFSLTLLSRFPLSNFPYPPPPLLPSAALVFRPLCSATAATTEEGLQPLKHSILLERLRIRHLKDSSSEKTRPTQRPLAPGDDDGSATKKNTNNNKKKKSEVEVLASSFEELGLTEETMGALEEMGISAPTEIQSIGIPCVLKGKSVVLGSHTGSGKTLAYMLPLAQLLRRDEALYGMLMKPRRPRAVVLCPTRELSEQVFRVAKSISHHARFRTTMVSGGTRLRPQEDSLNTPIDMVVGTPGRVLQHIEEGNMVYGDIQYLVLDEADTMFDRGFGPDIRKFLGPLKNRASKSDDKGFQTILVSATMTKAVQNLIDDEFQGIEHVRTSTLHKKIASARHDFIKLSGSENKLEALLQVLEPSLAKGNKAMVFCNTLNSSRAVDHFLDENKISSVNYHGEVPAEQRVENLQKFKSDDGDCPTLVCTDLAARGLDLNVDHVVMFDFPSNSIDYLHRTGRTARMGAKGKVTSLVTKKDLMLATRIEQAIMKNESLESLTLDNVRRDVARSQITAEKNSKSMNISNQKNKSKSPSLLKPSSVRRKFSSSEKTSGPKSGKASASSKTTQTPINVSKSPKFSAASSSKRATSGGKKTTDSRKSGAVKSSAGSSKRAPSGGKKTTVSRKSGADFRTSKLNVVGFRGRSSSSNARESLRSK